LYVAVTGVVYLYDCSILCLKIVSIAFYPQLWKQNAEVFCCGTIFYLPQFQAQCAMCRGLGGDSNKAQAQAVNDGIVYLMVIPYVLVADYYAAYRMRKKEAKIDHLF
jgi:hypothetical protein